MWFPRGERGKMVTVKAARRIGAERSRVKNRDEEAEGSRAEERLREDKMEAIIIR